MGSRGLPDLDADAATAGRAFRALFEHAPVGICAAKLDRRIFAMNPALQRILGLSEYRGLLVDALAPPEEVQRLNSVLDATATGEVVSVEGPLVRADGSRVETRGTVMYVRASGGEPSFVLAVIESRDEEMRSQEAVGTAQLLVHDINNLLMPIVAYAEMLLRGLSLSDPARADAEHVHGLAEKAVALARETLSERAAGPDEGTVDVNGVLLGMRSVVGDLLGTGIDVVVLPDLGGPHVRADAAGFERALFNIVANARDAMPAGGTLTIETEQEDDMVRIRVADTGAGMSREVRDHIFEPRFTTKETGHGMGLASVRAFAEKYQGSIAVESDEGIGTTVTLTLPAAAPTAPA
jgi:PAS domain S-box-containing protein